MDRSSDATVTSADAEMLVAALDEQATLPAIERLRATVLELLTPRPGYRLLDAGCGTGDVARRVGAEAGPSGNVIGVDASAAMVHEARRRTVDPTLPVEFQRGDITRLAALAPVARGAAFRPLTHRARPRTPPPPETGQPAPGTE
jgi:2-polyprenyl-3-methyl-5-hydroxy-6-metoxy-1,4-benzoquinol methylase